jgi:hypothetical protein
VGNSATLSRSTQVADQGVTTFVARNNSGVYSSLYATQICLTAGESPGYGFFGVPINDFAADKDPSAPTTALKMAGTAGKIKPGARIAFDFVNGAKTTTVLSGTLVQYVHCIHEDSVIGLVFDDKWLMSKVTVFGRATYDPRNGRYFFDAGAKCIFNELGFPNCVDTPYGPRFAPFHRFGWRLNDTEEPSIGAATERARSWTVADIMEYLREMHYSSGSQPPGMKEYGNLRVPHWVNWPKSLGHVFGDVRACMDFDLENKSVLQAVAMTLRRAGAYDLICRSTGAGFNSELYVANMNPPTNNTGYSLMLPDYDTSLDVAGLINTSNVIHSGYINESIINFSDNVTICGDPVVLERFMTTAYTGSEVDGMPTESLYGIEPAWDRGDGVLIDQNPAVNSDEWKVLDYVATNGPTKGYKLAWQQALSKWPTVFAEYRVPISSDVFVNTKWAGRANITNPRIRPNLLTGDNNEDANPGNWKPKPIVIEATPTGSNAWYVAARQNELTLTPDGRSFRIEALRDSNDTWYNTTSETYKPYADSDSSHTTPLIKPKHLRMTLAIESEFRITGRATSDPHGTGVRVTDATYTYLNVSSPLNYCEWVRDKSYPIGGTDDMHGGIPVALGGPAVFPDKCTEGNELFTDRINDDATLDGNRLPKNALAKLKFHKRIEYTGQLILANLNPAIHPGLAIQIDGRGTIPVFSVVKTVTFDSALQTTVIDLAAADAEQIYNIPAPGPMKSTVQEKVSKGDPTGDGIGGKEVAANGGSNSGGGGKNYDMNPPESYNQYTDSPSGRVTGAMSGPMPQSSKAPMEQTKKQQMEGDEGAAGGAGAEGLAGGKGATVGTNSNISLRGGSGNVNQNSRINTNGLAGGDKGPDSMKVASGNVFEKPTNLSTGNESVYVGGNQFVPKSQYDPNATNAARKEASLDSRTKQDGGNVVSDETMKNTPSLEDQGRGNLFKAWKDGYVGNTIGDRQIERDKETARQNSREMYGHD